MTGRRWTAAGLGLLIVVGLALRLMDIDARSISHPEMWAPLIPVPAELGDPPERHTLGAVIGYDLWFDTHPPVYYFFLWFWMKVFGASIWSIRVPAALFGAASIPLLFMLGERRRDGALAAVLLAFSGYHIAWSGLGRMYTMTCFLGLLSSLALLRMSRGSRRWGVVYIVSTVAGLGTNVFFWPLFAGQILWALWNVWNQRTALSDTWRAQVFIGLSATPLFTILAIQSHHPVATLKSNPWPFLREIIQFGFILPLKGFTDLNPHGTGVLSEGGFARVLLLIGCLFVFGFGWYAIRRTHAVSLSGAAWPYWRLLWAAGAIAGAAASVVFVQIDRDHPFDLVLARWGWTLPFLMIPAALAVERIWGKLPEARIDRSLSLPAVLAVLPFVLTAILSLFKPVFVQRGLLVMVPYVLLLLSSGLTTVLRHRITVVAAAVLLAILHWQSIFEYRGLIIDEVDFRELAQVWTPHIQSTDLIFMQRSYYATPILFYVRPPRYRVFASNFVRVRERNPGSRIWRVKFDSEELPLEIDQALAGYRSVEQERVKGLVVSLFVPDR